MSSARDAGSLAELETAVERLTEKEYEAFRRWFLERDWEVWDRQFETDSASGRLDFLAREARDTKESVDPPSP